MGAIGRGGRSDPVLAWLLDGEDPAARAQALVDLAGAAPDDDAVTAARAASLDRGSVARVLDGLSVPAGAGADAESLWAPKYGAAYHRLVALAEMGAPGDDPRVAAALEACLGAFAKPDGGFGRRESHLCVTGNVARAATLLGRGDDPRVQAGVAWLVARQREDGGWNCFPEDEPGGTLDSWEPLAAFGAIPPERRSGEVRRAMRRGVEFLLERRLGVEAEGGGYAPWRRVHFPHHYYYDFLLGLDLATALGDAGDARLRPALDLLLAKRGADGRWALDATHPDVDPEGDPPYKPIWEEFARSVVRVEVEPPGAPSRWATLAARRVLGRVDAAARGR